MNGFLNLRLVFLISSSLLLTPLAAQPKNSDKSSFEYFGFLYPKPPIKRLELASNLPIVLTEGTHLYPEKPVTNTHVVLAGTAHLYRAVLNADESSTIRLESENSFAEVVVNEHTLCPITRTDTPDEDNIQIIVILGELRWNGCGRVYYPKEISELIKLDDGSWKLTVKSFKKQIQKPFNINTHSGYFIKAIFGNEQPSTSQVILLT